MSRRAIHISLCVEGAMRWPERKLEGLFKTDDGYALSGRACKEHLQKLFKEGVRKLPIGEPCDGFDPVTGCPGHGISEEEVME